MLRWIDQYLRVTVPLRRVPHFVGAQPALVLHVARFGIPSRCDPNLAPKRVL